MPINTTENQVSGQLTAQARTFSVPFPFFADTDLKVWLTDSGGNDRQLVSQAEYAVTGGGGSGGTVEITDPELEEGVITVVREVPETQTVDLEEGDPLPSGSLERALDKLTVLVQQVSAKLDRTVRVGETSATLAAAQGLTNTVFGLDAEGQILLRDANALRTLLNLQQTLLNHPTKTWLDDVERTAAVPDFVGQVGLQQDTGTTYHADGTGAGEWAATLASVPDGTVLTSSLADLAVTEEKLADGAVTAEKLAESAVGNAQLAADAVGLAELAHTFGNSKLIATDAAGNPEAVNRSEFSSVLVQRVTAVNSTMFSTTSAMSMDHTIPQITEGAEFMTVELTPTDAGNLLVIEFFCPLVNPGAATTSVVIALFQDATANALQVDMQSVGDDSIPVVMRYEMTAGTTSATTFRIRAGLSNGGTLFLNQGENSNFGQIGRSYLTATEYRV